MSTPPPRKLGRPVDADSAETRQRLLDVARQTFATEGFARTTNRQIAEAAGITPGAIYHYFDSKAELYAAVYAEVQDLVHRSFLRAVEREDTLASQFSAALDAAVELNRADSSLAGFLVGTAVEIRAHPELAARLADGATPTTGLLHSLVAGAVERGELAPDVDARAVEDLLNVLLTGLARFSNVVGDADRHEATVGVLKRLLATGFMAPLERRTS